ncbi:conserved hypothetical protein [uncultured Thiomicrorhabdus sp.]
MRLYAFPDYLTQIQEICIKADWVIHNFKPLNLEDLYNPANYLHNIEKDNIKYELILDTNIYQFILSAYKKTDIKDEHRQAIALLVFCQLSEIEINPTFPVYEKLDYKYDSIISVLDDLDLFDQINSSDPNELALFALTNKTSFPIHLPIGRNQAKISNRIQKYERLTNWHNFYLVILVITDIHLSEGNRANKFKYFLDWMYYSYRKSFLAIIYASFFWGDQPLKRMMKLKKKQKSSERKRAIHNMTWDLLIMQNYLDRWIKKEPLTEYLFATSDNAFKELMRAAISAQKAHNLEPLKNSIGHSTYQILMHFENKNPESNERTMNTKKWSSEYISKMINELENKIFKQTT